MESFDVGDADLKSKHEQKLKDEQDSFRKRFQTCLKIMYLSKRKYQKRKMIKQNKSRTSLMKISLRKAFSMDYFLLY